MNIQEIDKTIERIRASETFDMSNYEHECGAPACIAGHAIVGAAHKHIHIHKSVFFKAMKVLDLDSELACDLFIPQGIGPYKDVTKEEAIDALERVKEGYIGVYTIWAKVIARNRSRSS